MSASGSTSSMRMPPGARASVIASTGSSPGRYERALVPERLEHRPRRGSGGTAGVAGGLRGHEPPRARGAAVRAPDLPSFACVVGDEVDDPVDHLECFRGGARRAGEEVGEQGRARRGPVRAPQFAAVDAVVGAEERRAVRELGHVPGPARARVGAQRSQQPDVLAGRRGRCRQQQEQDRQEDAHGGDHAWSFATGRGSVEDRTDVGSGRSANGAEQRDEGPRQGGRERPAIDAGGAGRRRPSTPARSRRE